MILRLPSVRIQSNRSSTCSEKTQSRLLPHLGPGPLLWRRRPMIRRLPSVRIQSDRSSTCSEKTQHPRRQQTCRIRRAHTRPQASLTFRRPVNRTMVRLRPQRLPRRLHPGPPLSQLPRRHRRPTPARIRRNPSSIFSRTSDFTISAARRMRAWRRNCASAQRQTKFVSQYGARRSVPAALNWLTTQSIANPSLPQIPC